MSGVEGLTMSGVEGLRASGYFCDTTRANGIVKKG
jgi:hypothetical protein